MRSAVELRTLSRLEQGRLPEPAANPWSLEAFAALESVVDQSLARPQPVIAPTVEPLNAAPTPQRPATLKQSLQNEALLKKLMQFRDQIPLSKRIIRASSHDLG